MADYQETRTPTAGQEGWHTSRYNLVARHPSGKGFLVLNLFKGSMQVCTEVEVALIQIADQLDADMEVLEKFKKHGFITNFDELAALDTMGRQAAMGSRSVSVTICPTVGCNFDCPYCFENHIPGKMSPQVQDDVVGLIGRMMGNVAAKRLHVNWFGGEPLLAPDVIEALSQRLIRMAEEKHAEYIGSVVTNGYLLTPENIDLLDRCRVRQAQVTVDGLREAHDATRHLAGGGPTFDRIISNLRNNKLPFGVQIRHNAHMGNMDQIEPLKALIREISEESGNRLVYYAATVTGSEVADERGQQVDLLAGDIDKEMCIQRVLRTGVLNNRGSYCGAHVLTSVSIDDKGNLYKCWNEVDKPELSFGTAAEWDVVRPIESAARPDNLTKYLNTTCPIPDPECRECVWLPTCHGNCPNARLTRGRACFPFKDDPEAFTVAAYWVMKERAEAEQEAQNGKPARDE